MLESSTPTGASAAADNPASAAAHPAPTGLRERKKQQTRLRIIEIALDLCDAQGFDATTVEQIASTIVHEATHARLERYGIEYEEPRRVKIEAICCRRELAFAVRLPGSAELQQDIARCLEWYQTNPEQFRDARFQEAHTVGGIEALRYLGTPDWIIRAISVSMPIIGRARRLFRFEQR